MIDLEGLELICKEGGVDAATQEKLRIYFEGLLDANAHKLADFAAGLVSEARRQDVMDRIMAGPTKGGVQ